jgi:phenylalanyl-tRNA synthetase beta chain
MNILIPHTWLLEHLATDVEPLELQKLVSLCGPSIERIYDREGESVYDIEVTTNRVDSMSVRGVAREAAVILQEFGKKAQLKPSQLTSIMSLKPARVADELPLPKVTLKTPACYRALAIILRDVERSATPEYMAKRLRQTDQNVHDAVIDITNYITHELGHPCHAFDYDKVMALGGEIIITEAQPGKKFITLDGAEFTTVGGEIVFENPAGEIIDLPAIKGTLNSSITADTKNILFWLESLDAKKVRVASMTHAIRTVAAQLEEKQADPHLAEQVLVRGVELFQEHCNAKIGSAVYDAFILPRSPKPISVPLSTISTYLGLELPKQKIIKILTELECAAKLDATQQKVLVTPPTFRQDLEIPADIVEEIARIYGYQNLPSTLMSTEIPLLKPDLVNFDLEFQLKHSLADRGWQELYTYSLVSEALALQAAPLTQHLKIANPLTDDKVYLRRSLLPSLQATAEEMTSGLAAGATLKVFELANHYTPSGVATELPIESLRLGLVSNQSYREVVGELQSLLQSIYRPDFEIQHSKKDGQSATIKLTGKLTADQELPAQILGSITQLKNGWWGVDLEMAQLVAATQTHPVYQPTAKNAALIEDLTFKLPAKTTIGSVMAQIDAQSPWIESVTLKDQYQQNFTFTITYRDAQSTLTSERVAPIRKLIVAALKNSLHAELIGTL